MSDENEQNVDCCGQPQIEDSEKLKKLKYLLIGGIIVYIVLTGLEIFYFDGSSSTTYIFINLILILFVFNKCFMVYGFYVFMSIFLLFGTAIPRFGLIIQTKFEVIYDERSPIVKFIINFFIIIFSVVYFLISFNAYKEIKALFIDRVGHSPYLANLNQGNSNNGNNSNYVYSSNNRNNNEEQNKNKGFKAFSGKGYRVGGS